MTPSLIDVTSQFYDEDYYGTSYDQSGIPYSRDTSGMARLLRRTRHVHRVDAAPRDGARRRVRGRHARRRAARAGSRSPWHRHSAWAIEQVPPGSAALLHGGFGHGRDRRLVRVDHVLRGPRTSPAVTGRCRASATSVDTRTACCSLRRPDDFDEPTHLNVEPGGLLGPAVPATRLQARRRLRCVVTSLRTPCCSVELP